MNHRLKDKSDEELMVLYQNGDEQAFAVLYNRYSAKVFGFLKNRLRDPVLADDIFQASFLKLHNSKSQFDSGLSFRTWIFTVTRTTMLDALRKSKLDNAMLENEKLKSRTQATDFGALANSSEAIHLQELSQLPENQRKAIKLRYEQELEFSEIARRLETSQSNARQLVSRGLKKLQGLISKKEARSLEK